MIALAALSQTGSTMVTKVIICSSLLLMMGWPERATGNPIVMLSDATTTKSAVLKYIPIGTSIDQAKVFMERNGFKCNLVDNQKYADYSAIPDRQITRGPADFLWCDSGERAWYLYVSKRWQVIFEDTGGRVSYVAVGVALTGP
jgi:hypothetical protein